MTAALVARATRVPTALHASVVRSGPGRFFVALVREIVEDDLPGMAAEMITTAAVGAVEGAIEVSRRTTMPAEAAAAAAATGAIEAAGEIGDAAAMRVRRAVLGTVRGIRVVAKLPTEEGEAAEAERAPEAASGTR